MTPDRAAVAPRVHSPLCGEALPLEDEIRRLLDEERWGPVQLVGPPGSGKTAALRHLAAVFADDPRLRLHDEQCIPTLPKKACEVAVFAHDAPVQGSLNYRLACWDIDDFVEYLRARHPQACGSVMQRITRDDRGRFGGLPEIWRAVLDELAAHEALANAHAALIHLADRRLEGFEVEIAGMCFRALTGATLSADEVPLWSNFLWLVRHRSVQLLLATRRALAELTRQKECRFLEMPMPRDLVEAIAAQVDGSAAARACLMAHIKETPATQAMAVSILHASTVGWLPAVGTKSLAGASLSGLSWPQAPLRNARLEGIDLSCADLRAADLRQAVAMGSNFSHAQFQQARLNSIQAANADFGWADLTEACADHAWFQNANLEAAKLVGASFNRVSFADANLKSANFVGAGLLEADLARADVTDADFSEAVLWRANLIALVLRQSCLKGAQLREAMLVAADMEEMDLAGVNFQKANMHGVLLTGARLTGANLSGANLQNAKLAEIDAEGASFRGANLLGATFHMGSSRSGLVGSVIPGEGSKLGFYTDDYDDRYFKRAEEIRKANLRGADLRGAIIEGVDFYLVDLRDARFDEDQAEHLARCGAILYDPA